MKHIIKKSAAIMLTAALAFGSAPAAVSTFVPSMSITASAATVTRSVSSWDAIVTAINDVGGSGTASITLSTNITAPASAEAIVIPDGVFVTLNLNNHTLSRGLTSAKENGYVIKIADGGELSISNGTVTGGYNQRVTMMVWDEEQEKEVEQVISSGNGGGIFGDYNSCLWMSNVKVTGNHAANGAGVWFNTQSYKSYKVNESVGKTMLSVSGCSFTNNTADEMGGAVVLANSANSNSDLHYISNTTFSGNQAKNGGALALSNANYLNLTDSAFTSNTATENGGAIYSPIGSFICSVRNTTIKNNSAKNGGGICSTGATVNIWNGSSISNNTASENGGGVYLEGAAAQLGWYSDTNTTVDNKGYITNNKAKNGGGVYVGTNGTINLQWGSITRNTASTGGKGAGIYDLGTVRMQNSDSSKNAKDLTVVGNTVTAEKDGLTLNLPSNIYISGDGNIDNTKLYQNGTSVAAGVSVDPSILSTHPDFESRCAAIGTAYPESYVMVSDDDAYTFLNWDGIWYINHVEAGAGYSTPQFKDSDSNFASVCTVTNIEDTDKYITTAAKTNISGKNYYAVWHDGQVRTQQSGTADVFTECVGSQAVISGDVKLNVAYTLSSADVTNLSNLSVNFSWNVNGKTETATSALTKSGSNYVAVVSLNPAELSSEITAELVGAADNEAHTAKVSVSSQLKKFLIDSDSSEALKGVSCSLADYSTFLQEIFDVNTEAPTNDVVSTNVRSSLYGTINDAVSSSIISGLKEGAYAHTEANLSKFASDDMKYIGSSLLFLKKTTLRHYFELTPGKTAPDIKVTVGTSTRTVKATASQKNPGWVYYDIEDISIETWGNDIKMTVGSDTNAYYYCPLDYALSVLSNELDNTGAKQDLGEKSSSYIKLSKAMHYCYKYAKAYAAESE